MKRGESMNCGPGSMACRPALLTGSAGSVRVDEKAVYELQGQHCVDLGGVVPVSLEVSRNYGLKTARFEIRPGKSARVEEYFPNVPCQGIPVPDPEMAELVPPEEEAFEAEGQEEMID